MHATTLKFFQPNYVEARDGFLQAAKQRGDHLESLEVLPGHTIDVALGDGPKDRVLLLSSGLHGVEGFAGSAIQQAVMADPPRDCRLVCLHALNPFGMATIRRVNENNVDLNRNFLPPGEAYFQPADSYRPFHPLLNPETPPKADFFLPKALALLMKHGMPALKQAVVGGQYEFSKGLFFGGEQLEKGPRMLMQALPDWLSEAEQIVHLDFHTGLGKSGTYALLVETEAGTEKHQEFLARYGDRVQPWQAGEGVAYQIRGGFPSAMERLFPGRIEVLTCEFGTQPALKVLQALRRENQVHHFGGSAKATAAAKSALRAAFDPQNDAWRCQILAGGLRVAAQAAQQLGQERAIPAATSSSPLKA